VRADAELTLSDRQVRHRLTRVNDEVEYHLPHLHAVDLHQLGMRVKLHEHRYIARHEVTAGQRQYLAHH
jgi:hypothetical protein